MSGETKTDAGAAAPTDDTAARLAKAEENITALAEAVSMLGQQLTQAQAAAREADAWMMAELKRVEKSAAKGRKKVPGLDELRDFVATLPPLPESAEVARRAVLEALPA
jgi:hypothetical protein